jgi:hypothetical protein
LAGLLQRLTKLVVESSLEGELDECSVRTVMTLASAPTSRRGGCLVSGHENRHDR